MANASGPRIVVTGGRNYADREQVFFALDTIRPSRVAEGGARGLDALAKEWAWSRGASWQQYPADWNAYGNSAGARRNRVMLETERPDMLVHFPGGHGTADCRTAATGLGIKQRSGLTPIEIDYYSPSAIETFLTCPRKWAFSKVDREPKEQTAAADQGTAVHDQHEAWLTKGVPYDLTTRAGELAMATVHLLPPPGVATVEREMTFTWQGVTFGGKLDGRWRGEGAKYAVVLDHKTTGNLAWAKLTKEALLEHPQAPIYVVKVAEEYGVDWVHLRWNYVETGGPKSTKKPKPHASWHWVHVSEALATMPKWHAVTQDMALVVRMANDPKIRLRALDVPYNAEGCAAFGGCQFAKNGKCNVTAREKTMSAFMQDDSFANKLAQLQAGKNGTPAAAPQAPLGLVTSQQPFPLAGAGPALAVAQQAPVAHVAQQPFLGQPAPAPLPEQGPPINYTPPEQQAPQPTHFGQAVNPPVLGQAPAPAPIPQGVTPAQNVEAFAAASEPPKRGRGRPRKNATTETASAAPPTDDSDETARFSDDWNLTITLELIRAYAAQYQPAQLAENIKAFFTELGK